jgi:hypothetical protein
MVAPAGRFARADHRTAGARLPALGDRPGGDPRAAWACGDDLHQARDRSAPNNRRETKPSAPAAPTLADDAAPGARSLRAEHRRETKPSAPGAPTLADDAAPGAQSLRAESPTRDHHERRQRAHARRRRRTRRAVTPRRIADDGPPDRRRWLGHGRGRPRGRPCDWPAEADPLTRTGHSQCIAPRECFLPDEF